MNFQQNTKAIYIQIADRLCDQILQGDYPPGERLPSVRDVAAELQVNANTVVRSFERLSMQNLVYNRRGIGYFVAEDAPERILAYRAETLLTDQVREVFTLLNQLHITPEQLAERYRNFIDNPSQV